MLHENIKALRKSKGLSQEDLALRLNVVRQTISKWEQARSVPDADLLLSLAEVLEVPVSTLLGETLPETRADDLGALSQRLETINLQLARGKAARRRALHWGFLLLSAATVVTFALLMRLGSPYLGWDYSQIETAVMGTALHSFEWTFTRLAPLVLIGSVVGACLTRRKL